MIDYQKIIPEIWKFVIWGAGAGWMTGEVVQQVGSARVVWLAVDVEEVAWVGVDVAIEEVAWAMAHSIGAGIIVGSCSL